RPLPAALSFPYTTLFRSALADYERRPLLDKALSGTFAPGSTFKPVVGLAAMKRGLDPSRRIFCGGSFYLGRRFACLGRHGALDRSEEHTSELQSRENLVC